jgi:hypothetical protein
VPSLAPLGFASRILDNPSGPPFLVAERKEEVTRGAISLSNVAARRKCAAWSAE